MFSPQGYVSLAELWLAFVSKWGEEIAYFARQKYQEDGFSPIAEFGSPADFVEDVFLKTLEQQTVSFCSLDGVATNLRPEFSDPFSKLFQRTTVLESSLIAQDSEEAGQGAFWLHQMGSNYFKPWPERHGKTEFWADEYVNGESRSLDIGRMPFHTLPYCFERFKFTLPTSLPPWCDDAIGEYYAKLIVPDFLGQSICVDESQAKEWRLRNIRKSEWKITLGFEPPRKIGRTGKQQQAKTYYHELFPDGHRGSWQAACNEIFTQFGFDVSIKTLKRALDSQKRTDKTMDKTRN